MSSKSKLKKLFWVGLFFPFAKNTNYQGGHWYVSFHRVSLRPRLSPKGWRSQTLKLSPTQCSWLNLRVVTTPNQKIPANVNCPCLALLFFSLVAFCFPPGTSHRMFYQPQSIDGHAEGVALLRWRWRAPTSCSRVETGGACFFFCAKRPVLPRRVRPMKFNALRKKGSSQLRSNAKVFLFCSGHDSHPTPLPTLTPESQTFRPTPRSFFVKK